MGVTARNLKIMGGGRRPRPQRKGWRGKCPPGSTPASRIPHRPHGEPRGARTNRSVDKQTPAPVPRLGGAQRKHPTCNCNCPTLLRRRRGVRASCVRRSLALPMDQAQTLMGSKLGWLGPNQFNRFRASEVYREDLNEYRARIMKWVGGRPMPILTDCCLRGASFLPHNQLKESMSMSIV